MMHSPFFKLVCCVACLLSALGALHLGLTALGYNVFDTLGHNLLTPFAYIVGVAGAVSIILHILKWTCYAGACKNEYERR